MEPTEQKKKFGFEDVPFRTGIFEDVPFRTGINDSKVVGFCKIGEMGEAVQSLFSMDYLIGLIKMLEPMRELGFHEIVVTLAPKGPIVFGGKKTGIALAPKEWEMEG